jgi:hypothetical protein
LRANLPTPLRLDEEQAMGAVWQDVRTKAVERLAGRDRRFSHFMGALVLESRAKPSVKQVPSFQIVDGQQRLTTFQIFLTAARHYALKIGYATAASNIQRFVMNSDPQLMEQPRLKSSRFGQRRVIVRCSSTSYHLRIARHFEKKRRVLV